MSKLPKESALTRLTSLVAAAQESHSSNASGATSSDASATPPTPPLGRPRPHRGLLGLIVDESMSTAAVREAGKYREVSLDLIDRDPNQPRQYFDEESLEELAAQLKHQGLLQLPIIRPHPTVPGRFMIVFGERRIRSARMLGWEKIEVRFEDWDDLTTRVAQILENNERARKNVRPWEEATALGELERLLGSATEITNLTGLRYPYVSKRLSLLKLPDEIRQLQIDGLITDDENAYSLGTLWNLDQVSAQALIAKVRQYKRLERDWLRLAVKNARARKAIAKGEGSAARSTAPAISRLQLRLEELNAGHRVRGSSKGKVRVELHFPTVEAAAAFVERSAKHLPKTPDGSDK